MAQERNPFLRLTEHSNCAWETLLSWAWHGLLLQHFLFSTQTIHRGWLPLAELDWEMAYADMQKQTERTIKILWTILPQVGLLFVAALPSYSTHYGYQDALSTVHAVCAIIAMACMASMEVVQLGYGEQAYQNFFGGQFQPSGWSVEQFDNSGEQAAQHAHLTAYQRWRVVLSIYAWMAIVLFMSAQVCFGLGQVAGIQIKPHSHILALMSYFAEITCLILVYTLPAISGMETLDAEGHNPCSPMSDAFGLDIALWDLKILPTPRGV